LDEFRHDLKNSIGKIEDQLREKVDRMNLDEFGRKFDHKLVNEVSKKIDKNDLKRNNNALSKKVYTNQERLITLKTKLVKLWLTHLLIYKWKKLL
jgi:FtsZ-binding cell division protein ZapB